MTAKTIEEQILDGAKGIATVVESLKNFRQNFSETNNSNSTLFKDLTTKIDEQKDRNPLPGTQSCSRGEGNR